jgi:hypothetical protein
MKDLRADSDLGASSFALSSTATLVEAALLVSLVSSVGFDMVVLISDEEVVVADDMVAIVRS